jgi:Xaa-Pro aminopeptidase
MTVKPGRSPAEILRAAPPVNLEHAREVMAREGLDGIVVSLPINAYHFTGYWPATSRMGFTPNVTVLLSRDPQQPISIVTAEFTYYYLLADLPYEYPFEWCLFMGPGGASLMFEDVGLEAISDGERVRRAAVQAAMARQPASADANAAIVRALRATGLDRGRVAVDSPDIASTFVRAGLAATVLPAEQTLQRIRLIKSSRELELMRAAATANVEAALAAAAAARAGATYRELRTSFNAEAARRGNRGVFMVIGGVSAEGVDRTLRDGDAFLFDAVSEGAGYHGDFARTVFVGEPAATARRATAAMLLGWDAIRDAMRPGLRFSEITALGRETVRKAGYDFLIAFGPHSVGLQHSDAPGLGDVVLEPGMVISVDCPVMQTGIGGSAHLEDLTLITASGSEPIHRVSAPTIQV